jgi:hypothetical protein
LYISRRVTPLGFCTARNLRSSVSHVISGQ